MLASSWGTDAHTVELNEHRARRLPWMVGGGVGALVGLVVAIVVALVTNPAIGALVGVMAGIAVAVGVATQLSARALEVVLGAVAWTAADEVEHARLLNVVESTCAMGGIGEVEVGVIESAACNTVTAATRDRSVILVTSGLLEQLDLMALEGLVAREVARLRSGDARLVTTVAATVGLPLVLAERGSGRGRFLSMMLSGWSARAVAGLEAGDRVMRADLDAASLTRYPPGLETALRVIAEHDTALVGVPRVAAALSVASPDEPGEGGPLGSRVEQIEVHPPLAMRIAMLTEL